MGGDACVSPEAHDDHIRLLCHFHSLCDTRRRSRILVAHVAAHGIQHVAGTPRRAHGVQRRRQERGRPVVSGCCHAFNHHKVSASTIEIAATLKQLSPCKHATCINNKIRQLLATRLQWSHERTLREDSSMRWPWGPPLPRFCALTCRGAVAASRHLLTRHAVHPRVRSAGEQCPLGQPAKRHLGDVSCPRRQWRRCCSNAKSIRKLKMTM